MSQEVDCKFNMLKKSLSGPCKRFYVVYDPVTWKSSLKLNNFSTSHTKKWC